MTRYFLIYFRAIKPMMNQGKIGSVPFEDSVPLSVENGRHPQKAHVEMELKKKHGFSQVMITNIHEFKSEQDFNDFIGAKKEEN